MNTEDKLEIFLTLDINRSKRGREAIDELLRETNRFLTDLLAWLYSDE